MERYFTFREAAERFCELDGRASSDVQTVYLQVKGLYDRGLLKVVDVRAARGASLISKYELCRARLLLALIDCGLESSRLEYANAQMESGGRTLFPDGRTIDHTLAGLIAATNGGWVLRINMLRVHSEGGALRSSVKLLPAWMAVGASGNGPREGDPTDPESTAVFIGATHIAFSKIPASALIAPLVADA